MTNSSLRLRTGLAAAALILLLGVLSWRSQRGPSRVLPEVGRGTVTHALPWDPLEDPPAEISKPAGTPEQAAEVVGAPPSHPDRIAITEHRDEVEERDGKFGYRAEGYRLTASAEGITAALPLQPREGRRQTLNLTLDEIRVGGQTLARGGPAVPTLRAADRAISYARGPVEERYTLHKKTFEQDFVIRELPSKRGEIVARVAVSSTLTHPSEGSRGGELRFTGAEGEAFTVSQALAYDAAGRKLPLEMAYSGGAIHMTLPAGWVADASLPITIDPIIGSVIPIASQTGPWGEPLDVAYASSTNQWMVVWSYDVNATDTDIRVRRVAADGSLVGNPIIVGSDSLGASQAVIAYAATANKYLVVWGASAGLTGRFLLPDGSFASDPFIIPGGAFQPSIATDGTGSWFVATPGTGRILDMSGNLITSFELPGSSWPKVAYSQQLYMMTVSNSNDTVCRAFDTTGNPVTPVTVVETGAPYIGHVAGGDGKFFFTYMDGAAQSLRGRVAEVSQAGAINFLTAPFQISIAAPGASAPAYSWAAYSGTSAAWYAVYQRGSNQTSLNITAGNRIEPSGQVSPEDVIATPTGTYMPRVAWNSTTNEMLVVFTSTGVNPIQVQAQRVSMGPGAIPPIPTSFRATPGNDQVTLQWNPAGLASGYNVSFRQACVT